jgi:predicted ArsR family transcriptional regulator
VTARTPPLPDPAELRARVLAEPTRRRLWDAVRSAPEPLGVADLARALDIHPNTVRLHLARLVDAGLVEERTETDRHPGRPGYRYQAVATDPLTDAAAYRRLAGLLAGAVRAGVSARNAGRAAGAAEATHFAGADPVTSIVAALSAEGFMPTSTEVDDQHVDITLHACPFADAAAADPAVICQLHLGLAEGTASAIGGLRVDALRITDPHQAGCRIEVSRVPQPLKQGPRTRG